MNLQHKRPHGAKSERKDICASRLCFSCVSCSFLFFWRSAALGLVDGDPSTGMGGSKQPVADGLSVTLNSKCWFLTVLLLSKVETRNWKCWFVTVLLLSKHEMLVAVEFLWFEFLTFYGSLLLFSVWFTCVRYSLATALSYSSSVLLVGPQPQTPALFCVANKNAFALWPASSL